MRNLPLLIIFIFSAVLLYADGRTPNTYSSQSIYKFENTNSVTSDVLLSTSSGVHLLHTVNVNTAGTGSKLEIFSGSVSTDTATKIASIDTTSVGSYFYNIHISSGLLIYNQGSPAADVTISYLDR